MRRALALVFFLIAGPAGAQGTLATTTRLEQVAQYIASSGACPQFGYAMDMEGVTALQARVLARAEAEGMSSDAAKGAFVGAMDRQLQVMRNGYATALANVEGATNIRAATMSVMTRLAKKCREVAADPDFAVMLKAPSPADEAIKVRDYADSLLESGGYASWQTAAIQARGDLAYAAGTCRAHLSPAAFTALIGPIVDLAKPVDQMDRERRYYARSYQRGMESAAEDDFDEAQCARLIARNKAKLAPKK